MDSVYWGEALIIRFGLISDTTFSWALVAEVFLDSLQIGHCKMEFDDIFLLQYPLSNWSPVNRLILLYPNKLDKFLQWHLASYWYSQQIFIGCLSCTKHYAGHYEDKGNNTD